MGPWAAWGYSALSYGFAASGLALGAGALVTGRPLAGACGAVGGVTMGLLERYRADVAERRVALLRTRLRDQRAESQEVTSGLRLQIRDLQSQLWRRDLADVAPSPSADQSSDPLAPQVADESPQSALTRPAQVEWAQVQRAPVQSPPVLSSPVEPAPVEVTARYESWPAESAPAEQAAHEESTPVEPVPAEVPTGPIAPVIDLRAREPQVEQPTETESGRKHAESGREHGERSSAAAG